MKVTVKNLPMHLVFGEYNGQECEVQEEFHSRQYGTSLRVRAMDGREFTVGPAQYIAPKADAARFAALAKSERKQFMAPDCAESSPTAHGARPRPWKRHDRRGVSHVFRAGLAITLEASPRNGSMCHRSQQMGST